MLRVGAIVLVLIHHVALTYSGVAPWYYVEPTENFGVFIGFLVLVLFNQAFFMGLLFMLSGYFTPVSYDRKGFKRFLRNRFVRLGIPLIVYIFLLNPLATFAGYTYITQVYLEGIHIPYEDFYLSALNAGPLWFLQVLLLFVVGYGLWRLAMVAPMAKQDATPQSSESRDEATRRVAPPSLAAIGLFILGLAAATFVWRIWVPMGTFVPIIALPSASHMPQYLSLFVIGAVAFRQNWFHTLPAAYGRIGGVATLLSILLFFPVLLLSDENWMGGSSLPAFLFALWESIFCVNICLALLVYFRGRFTQAGSRGAFLSNHAYTVFIIHGPILAWYAYGLQGIALHPLLKFVLVSITGTALCFAAAYFVRKLPLARRIL